MSIMMSATVTCAWQSPSSGGVGEVEGAMMKGYAEAVLALLGDSSITRPPEPLPYLPGNRRGQDDEHAAPPVPLATVDGLAVYPNPSANDFTITYALKEEARELRFEVFDATGRKVRESALKQVQQGSLTIGLAPCGGLYVLRVSADGRTVGSRKLICSER